MIAFNKYYNQFNILSISLVVISLFLLTFKGLNFGIDFKGGTLIELRSTDSKINVSSLRDNLNSMNLGDVSVKNFGNETDFLIKFEINNFCPHSLDILDTMESIKGKLLSFAGVVTNVEHKEKHSSAITLIGNGIFNAGIKGSESFTLSFNESFDEQKSLYYYCSSHSSMNNSFMLTNEREVLATAVADSAGNWSITTSELSEGDYSIFNTHIYSSVLISQVVNWDV